MAGIKEGLTKGLATINVKTSNFMEENKLKTHITTLETEIEKLKLSIGETIYLAWDKGENGLDNCVPAMENIKKKYETITELKREIASLEEKEKEILGSSVDGGMQAGQKFCTKCGNPLLENAKFCTKCGNPTA